MQVQKINNAQTFESRKLVVRNPLVNESVESAIRSNRAVINFIEKGEPRTLLQKFANVFKRQEILEAKIGQSTDKNLHVVFSNYKKPFLNINPLTIKAGHQPAKGNIGGVYAFDSAVQGENFSKSEIQQRLLSKLSELRYAEDIEKILK